LEEYADPAIYDCENKEFEPDGPFYLALAQRLGGPVLEMGCGTGRITIPLAQHGIDITGLDVVPGMLERAKSKAGGLAVCWVEADARAFHLDNQFRFIFESGAAFQHMLERQDQEAMLARVREHLAPDGCFVVSSIFPRGRLLENVESEQEWFSYLTEQGQQVRVSGTQYYDSVRQIKLETAYRRWRDSAGQQVTRCAPLSLRYTFPQEMEALLHYNGFLVVERYGDWDQSPLSSESRSMLYVCQQAVIP
jgi:SAM-dependent methyltransferase